MLPVRFGVIRHMRNITSVLVIIVFGYCSIFMFLSNYLYPSTIPIPYPVIEESNNENVTLEDIYISVKTSDITSSRLPIILKTWFQLAKEQTWFFTDSVNETLQTLTNGHMINTKCMIGHIRPGLNCKMGVEYNTYIESNKKWFCHFDDDNYVNVPRLLDVLQKYHWKQYWYLGKRSILKPVTIAYKFRNTTKPWYQTFFFGTGGAGFCLSRPLASKMYPILGKNGFKRLCTILLISDDVCIGFGAKIVMKTQSIFTQVPGFHSHLERMRKISLSKIRNQISFSYKIEGCNNVVNIPGFDVQYDPTRFLSLHCLLFPYFEYCKQPGSNYSIENWTYPPTEAPNTMETK
ncbi:fringe glycosyltransferase-like [Anticarsia gemmatalis]|uniref:fringe glycosyltransferase-like n=1 Tax=Anticarsia gemmatalis TaxID=129554 RepID=UPI003F770901